MLLVDGGGITKRALERFGPEKASIKVISKIWSRKCHASEFDEVEYNWINFLHHMNAKRKILSFLYRD